jgi:hypothetical protein
MKRYPVTIILLVIASFVTSEAQNRILVEGFVSDRESLEKLVGATISLDSQMVSTTDSRGYYRFLISPGEHVFEVRMVGYQTARKDVRVREEDATKKIFFQLTPEEILIDSITVFGLHTRTHPTETPLSLLVRELKSLPAFAEPDPLRAIQSLPGVTTATSDFNSQIYLRGGNFDETLIALDGVPVYNPYHFAGWLSMFNSDIIQAERLYRSNYPVRFGGHLSGVVDLVTKAGSRERYRSSVSLGISSLRGVTEGPLGAGSLVVSARRTFLDAVLNTASSDVAVPFSFYDLYGKYSSPLSSGTSVQISALVSRDSFDPFQSRNPTSLDIREVPNWSNLVLRGTIMHELTKTASLDATIYFTRSYVGAEGALLEGTYYADPELNSGSLSIANAITDITGSITLAGRIGDHTLDVGVEAKRIGTAYSWNINWKAYTDIEEILFPRPERFFDYAPDVYSRSANSTILTFFASDAIRLTNDIDFMLGYRASLLNHVNVLLHSPYLSGLFQLTGNIRFNVSYGRYYQHLYTLRESKTKDNFFSPFSLLFLPKNSDEIGRSDHFSVGLDFSDLFAGASLNIEAYYKTRDNLASSYNDIQAPYIFETGYATGIDILVRREGDVVTGWLAYSLSRSIKRNGSFAYFANADRTHALKLMTAFKPFETLRLDLFWTIATGVPFTNVVGQFIGLADPGWQSEPFEQTLRAIDGRKNSVRAIPYQRLDVGITGSFIWGNVLIMPYLQVFNVYNAPNPYFFNYGKEQRASSVVPTVGVTVEF